ncbi:MAG TPA: hypoxanthine phosphoribosyltransferase [candidate division WOR-3 bacterium]|uniref:Hypoxanthine phosphoribosyltransferase n=1 Tax=candidate division WOR-3 bacterium TaxID=2052148 RepID=A0A7V0XE66_UNCW3|nr:hypoxanthine phosphoribosyltransferase [candidate division WOR-3 bacterium]
MSTPPREAVRELLSEKTIARRVSELAARISADYAGREVIVIGILKGSWIFLADLVRLMTVPVVIDFMTVSSYGTSTRTSGVVKIVTDLKCPLEGRDVLLVEDILDSGLTMRYLLDNLRRRGPRSLRVCVLMDKPARRKVEIRPDYVGFEVPDEFVVGYGTDYAERFRHLPFIGCLENREGEGDDAR